MTLIERLASAAATRCPWAYIRYGVYQCGTCGKFGEYPTYSCIAALKARETR